HKRLKEYYQAIDQGILPVSKGFKLSKDDIIRRDVIMQIMSSFYLDKSQIEAKYHLDFDSYFAQELIAMRPLIADGLVQSSYDAIVVTNLGRLLVRNIAFLFDTHTLAQQEQRLSRAI
ncbi:MAG TPA: coproporphyrinogen III oxidase, partial [Oscillatoriales bacterium UBA8482]|nr:coproporphyrinogen III oxidase [Oscillatoriales bacterium UBA8482]